MSGLKAKNVVHYVFMPEILPRCKQLFASGFGYIAFLMAQIYSMVRLIPAGHPYLLPENIGKFGIRHVVAQAANNLVLKKENADQIIIFTALLLGIVLLLLQLAMVVFTVLFGSAAMAGTAILNYPIPTSIFTTAKPTYDIAFILLDQVLGIGDGPGKTNFFNSCIAQSISCDPLDGTESTSAAYPWPFHEALHGMFKFYSTGILFIGALIFLYFIVVIVAETATTGTPFGQRFQNIWVPVRLVVAIGLLVPTYHGLNSGQYIVLAAAKYGSGFATNTWIRYNKAIAENEDVFPGGDGANPTGEKESLVAMPTPPDIAPMVQAMSIVHSCAFAHWLSDHASNLLAPRPPSGYIIKPYFVKQPQDWMTNQEKRLPVTNTTTYQNGLDFYGNSDIVIRFGINGDADNDDVAEMRDARNEKGYIIPTCGDIRIPVKTVQFSSKGEPLKGPERIQQLYFDLVKNMWFEDKELIGFAGRYASIEMGIGGNSPCTYDSPSGRLTPTGGDCRSDKPNLEWRQFIVTEYQADVTTELITAWNEYVREIADYEMTTDILDRGWGGAGIWFNKISALNGSLMESINDFPKLDRYPKIMEEVREDRREQLKSAADGGLEQFSLQVNVKDRNGTPRTINITSANEQVAGALSQIFIWWNESPPEEKVGSSAFEDGINLIFGTQGLFSMTEANNHVHPLAQLTMLGKGLVEASIRNVVTSTVASSVGGLSIALDSIATRLIEPFSKFILSTAFVGLTAGLVLYYILPFLPFIYFFFAVGGWVKTIFEALVGAPLWALAHLRLDGEGLPGNSASNGYFLIFEILIRPVLSIFGLVAGILIFTAQLRVLNFLWELVTSNLAGFEGDSLIGYAGTDEVDKKTGETSLGTLTIRRSIVDQFFFTVMYAMIAYMMAVASFKLIDKIPDKILRWMGGSVSSFSDINQDPTEGLTKFAALGGLTAGRQVAEGIQSGGQGLGGAFGKMFGRK